MIKVRQDKQDIEVWLEDDNNGEGVYVMARNVGDINENILLAIDEEGIARISHCDDLAGIKLDDEGRVVDVSD